MEQLSWQPHSQNWAEVGRCLVQGSEYVGVASRPRQGQSQEKTRPVLSVLNYLQAQSLWDVWFHPEGMLLWGNPDTKSINLP